MTPQHPEREIEREDPFASAQTGEIVTLYGTPWRIIGWIDRPAALLERVGCEETPVNHRSHHTVCIGSDHARQFRAATTSHKGASE